MIKLKNIAIYTFLLYPILSLGCSCSIPQQILEFASSDFVFIGEVVQKEYTPDSLHYKITFNIKKHFKKGHKPKRLSFVLKSEGKYSGVYTSCDWSVGIKETWLIYAKKDGEELKFGFHCSNSKPIDKDYKISEKEWTILKNGNTFNYSELMFSESKISNSPNPLVDIDSLINILKKKRYNDIVGFDTVVADYDEEGRLTKANLKQKGSNYEKLNYFGIQQYINLQYRVPKTEFEKDILNFVRTLKKWEPLVLKKHNISVKHRVYFRFKVNTEGYIEVEYF